MKKEHAKRCLFEIARVYPTLLGMLTKKQGETTVGEIWAAQLEPLEGMYVEDVCGEFAECLRPLPDTQDRLIQIICEDVRDRRQRDMNKLHQHAQYHTKPKEGAWSVVRKDKVGNHAIRLGQQVKAGTLTTEENESRLEELIAWDKGGPKPKWIADDAQQQT